MRRLTWFARSVIRALTAVTLVGWVPLAPSSALAVPPPSLTFSAPQFTETCVPSNSSMYSHGFVAADLNGDGRTDYAITHEAYGGNPAQVVVMLRDEVGDYWIPGRFAIGATNKVWGDLTAGDYDQDGDIDLATGAGSAITVFANIGSGSFQRAQYAYDGATWVQDVEFTDHDRDGDLDLLAAGGTAGTVKLFEYDSAGATFADTYTWSMEAGSAPSRLVLGDVSGDGRADVWVKDDYDATGAFYEMTSQAETFTVTKRHTPRTAYFVSDAAFGDVDNDGDLDAVVTDQANFMVSNVGAFLYRDGDFSATPEQIAVSSTGAANTDRVGLADLDRDGDLDLLGTNGGLFYAENLGDGIYSEPVESDGGAESYQFAVCDDDLNGLPDAFGIDHYDAGFERYPNVGAKGTAVTTDTPVFDATTLPDGGTDPYAVEVADLNRDGHQDLLWVNYVDQQLWARFGNGDGTFGEPKGTGLDQLVSQGWSSGSPSDFVIADFTKDGWADVGVVSWADSRITVMRQNVDGDSGDGNGFFSHVSSITVTAPRRAVALDFDQDGDQDIICTSPTATTWLTNDGSGGLTVATTQEFDREYVDVALMPQPDGSAGASRRPGIAICSTQSPFPSHAWHYYWAYGLPQGSWDGDSWAGPVVADDFQRDGRADLMTGPGSAGDRLGVFRVGPGGSGTTDPYSAGIATPSNRVLAADVNGDGCVDAVLAGSANATLTALSPHPGDSATGYVSILLGSGLGYPGLHFTQTATLTAGPGTRDIAAGDFNEDGMTDFVTADPGATGGSEGLTLFIQAVEPPDTTPPVVTTNAVTTYSRTASISITATDGVDGSGVASVSYKLDGAATQTVLNSVATVSAGRGAHSLRYWAEDLAGNETTHATVAFNVIGTVSRVDGYARYDVAANLARKGWDPANTKAWTSVKHVIVANGENGKEADPLSAAGLAGVYDCPVLTVQVTKLPAATKTVIAEIAKRNPGVKVHIIGGTASVPDARWNEIKAIPGVSPTKDRIAGADRYSTSAAIANRVVSAAPAAGKTISGVMLIAGDNPAAFYDALAASPIAFAKTMPMLSVKKGSLPPSVGSLLNSPALKSKPKYAASSATYMAVVPANTTRLTTSANRYTAAAQIGNAAITRTFTTATHTGLAAKLPDALTGGTYLGKKGGVMLFTDSSSVIQPASKSFITTRKTQITNGWVIGGTASVPAAQETSFRNLLK